MNRRAISNPRALLPVLCFVLASNACGDGRAALPAWEEPTPKSASPSTQRDPATPPPPAPATGATSGASGPTAPTSSVVLRVDANASRRAISPLVYGMNQDASTPATRYGLLRFGGNRFSAYNWENNASNAGSDWLYQNDGYLSANIVPGAAVGDRIDAARGIGAAALVTVPILDYVAADRSGGGDVRNSGPSYLSTRFRQNRATKGQPFTTPPNTTDGFVYQDEFVAWVKAEAGAVPVLFSLDNEPDLWADTHAEVHPSPVTYEELVERTVRYATAVKAVWPSAPVSGFVSYGFGGYVTLQDAPDASSHGDFIDYYLAKMRDASTGAGRRLIDYLDLHWYPEARGGGARITGNGTGAALVAARLQAPRSLWDPSYREDSWIADYLDAPIALLDRLEAQIAGGYPGTQLAFTEWNFGGGSHISGAIATADVLGIFGQRGVGIGAYWKLSANEAFAEAAFAAYRNFDGKSGQFGDTSVSATTSDAEASSVYASIDAANPSRVVIVALNKRSVPLRAEIDLTHATSYTRAHVYQLTGASAAVVAAADLAASAANHFSYDMPAMSVSVITPTP
ncbi:MAG: glycoside hydrolase family 44 protein [Deltaproteobacteria bacterium]|nr:glycoside hydrolase family 44 protein [Deltaproteobacteria bacterium]